MVCGSRVFTVNEGVKPQPNWQYVKRGPKVPKVSTFTGPEVQASGLTVISYDDRIPLQLSPITRCVVAFYMGLQDRMADIQVSRLALYV